MEEKTVQQSRSRLAVLIDGENVSPVHFAHVRKLACAKGTCVAWRVFGNFTNPAHAGWLDVCKMHGLEAVLQLPVTSGKNAADIAITVAAMDLAHDGKMTGLVIVSNDRDFVPLVRRLRAGGLDVHGIGSRESTPVWEGMFTSHKTVGAKLKNKPQAIAPDGKIKNVLAPPTKMSASPELIAAVLEILTTSAMHLGALGMRLREVYPDLAPQLGNGRLKKLVSDDVRIVLDGEIATRKKR